MEVRLAVIDYMVAHSDDYRSYPDTQQTWEDFIVSSRQNGFFAGEPCVAATAERFQLTILVHTLSLPIQCYGGGGHTVYELIGPIDKYQRSIDAAKIGTESDLTHSLQRLSARTVLEMVFLSQDSIPTQKKHFSLINLARYELFNEENCIAWLRREEIIEKTHQCMTCGIEMNYFPPYPEHRFGIFRCPHCRKVWTPLHDTIFRKSRISCVQFMTLALGWLLKDTNKGQAQSTSISNRSVSTFTLKMNAFAEATLKRQHQKLGGLMHVVEIDEALLHRRKYNRGRAKDSGWILGGIERPTSERPVPRAFLVECPDRKQETLEKIIQENVEPGAIILTDSFRSYLHISRLGYYHYVVTHSKKLRGSKNKSAYSKN